LFLIYNQKYYYTSLLNKLYDVLVCARTAGNQSAVLVCDKSMK